MDSLSQYTHLETLSLANFFADRLCSPRFSQADIRPFAQDILMALFTNIERGQTPEKMAENDYLMRCEFRLTPDHLAPILPS